VSDYGAHNVLPGAALLQHEELGLVGEERVEAGQGYWLVVG
jgi:hypothetical protein